MSFINPFLLIGIIAAGIPLLIHLWSRRQARLVNFSYVRFLTALNRKKIRRLRIKQILILIIRTLIITLIVMALARPILSSKWALAVGKTKTSAVIILDNSYSMSYEDLKGRRFDMAKTKALSLLDYLKPGDNAGLILMSDRPELVFKKLTSDIQQVKDSVKAANISHKGTNVLTALSEAYKLLEESDHPYKVIYFISDLGENGWSPWKDLPETKYDVHIFVIRLGEMNSDNRSVDTVALSSEPVGIGSSVEISTRISSSFSEDDSQALAELFIDGEKRGQAIANPKNPIIFNHKFNDSGFRIGEIRITPDKLSLDDVRYFVTNILGQVRVLSIGDSRLYVNIALNPVTPLNPSEKYFILPTDGSTGELEKVTLEQYNVVILTDLPELSYKATKNLENYVFNGGNVIIFLGDSVNPNWYNNRFNLMPVNLGERADYSKKPLRLGNWQQEHPILKVFSSTKVKSGASDALKSFEFYSAFSLNPKITVNTIASFENNIPAIIETESGKGRILLFNTSPDPKISDLPLKPGFLPIMQQTIFYLMAASKENQELKNISVGDTYTNYISGKIESGPTIYDPEGNSFIPIISATEKENKIQYGPVERAGIYKMEYKSEGEIHQSYFAVNLNTSGESQLKSINDGVIRDKLGKNVRFLSLDESPEDAIERAKSKSEISPWLLIGAGILMLLEIPLANRRKMT